MLRRILTLVALAGCIETGFSEPVPTDDPDTGGPGDGVDGSVDLDCEVELPEGREVQIDTACVRDPWSPPEDPWDVAVKWHMPAGDPAQGSRGVVVMPAVGNLTDDNLDGFIDDRDIPDIAYSVLGQDILEVRSGDDGRLLFTVPNILGTAGVAIADVTGDGRSEVIAARGGATPSVVAIDGEGQILWQSRGDYRFMIYGTPVVGDLDGDGSVEIVFDIFVVDGPTGRMLNVLQPTQAGSGLSVRSPVIGDVDLDGRVDILLGPNRLLADGSSLWSNDTADPRSVHTAIANIDADPEGEILMLSGFSLDAFDPGGRRRYRVLLPSNNGGPPCVADFDGDGEVEIGLGVGTWVSVYELDGTLLWEHPSVDSTLAHAGCSGYDFDGDGQYELLHADQHTFFIFDGATGRVLYRDDRHTSTTVFEYPVVADVDRDGSADIVIGSNINEERSGWAGITVFEHVDRGWARSGATWGVHDFAVTNLGNDGSVPSGATPPWLVHNVFRARPTVDSDALPNLKIKVVDACVGACDQGPVRLSYVVTNEGGIPVRPGTGVALYIVDGDERIHHTTDFLPAIPPGTSLPGREITLEPSVLRDAILLVVDDDGNRRGIVEECRETDNFAPYEREICDADDL